MSTPTKPACRSYEKKFEINAPKEAVWEAITEGDQLTRWFCEAATTEPGLGGKQTIDWGGGAVATHTVTAWEPGVHLRTESNRPDMADPSMPAPAEPYAIDWYLEHDKGVTKVRMVASGFGEGPKWDHEYDGTFTGWDMFHCNMKHYLENHRGQTSANVVLYAMLTTPVDEAWARLFSPAGLAKEGSIQGVQPGSRFRLVSATGDTFEGTVRKNVAPKAFSAVLDSLNKGVIWVEMCKMGPAYLLYFTVLTWGLPKEDIEALKQRLHALVYGLFPQPDRGPQSACAAEAEATATA